MNSTRTLLWMVLLGMGWVGAIPAQERPTSESGPVSPQKGVVWKPTASWLAAKRDGVATAGSRLVILVSGDGAPKSVTALQGLLEAEAFGGWHGELLERTQLEAVLREQQLTTSFGEANGIKLGQVAQADFLLLVSVESNRVRCRVNQFPSTVVVAEFDLPSAVDDRIAKQIALRSFRAMGERSRDVNRISIAIGSFLVDDPFSKYTDLDQNLHGSLREQLAKLDRVDITERFHPSQLLREFELGRAGLVPSTMAQLTAPASDILIVGDIQPSAKQDLNSKEIELNFRVRVISPTGLFDAFDVSFQQLGADAKQATDQITRAVQKKVRSLPESLARKTGSAGLDSEYALLKQRVFKLLPSPPKEDGNFHSKGSYRGSGQWGTPVVIQRTLRAVENALLLKEDDSQVLVCVIPLLIEMATQETPNRRIEKPSPRQKALMELSCDYIETALALDFNENTRGVAYETLFSREDYWYVTPDRMRRFAERMVREGTEGGWFPHQVDWPRIRLLEHTPDLNTKIAMFQAARRDKSVLPWVQFEMMERSAYHFHDLIHHNGSPEQLSASAGRLRELAAELEQEPAPFSKGMAAFLNVFVSFFSQPRDPKWVPEIKAAIELIPAVASDLGKEFDRVRYAQRVNQFIVWSRYPKLTDETLELTERYVVSQAKMENFGDSTLTESCTVLLPEYDRQEKYAEGIALLTPILEQYNWGGSSDYDRMKLARWRNHFERALSKRSEIPSSRLVEIALSGGKGEFNVKKVVSAFDRVWALRCDYFLQDHVGEVFVVSPTETKGVPVDGISKRVTDMAASKDQLAIATIDNGLYLLDRTGKVSKHLKPGDSPLPSIMVRTVAANDSRFLLGIPGVVATTGYSSYFIYDLDPQANTLKRTEARVDYHTYYQTRFDKLSDKVVAQNWNERFYEANGERMTFRRNPVRKAIHTVTVTDSANKIVFKHTGFDLNYVYDFAYWQGRLVFATGNGLYVARPNTDRLVCVLNELDLQFFSLCPVGDALFIGTNRGLHRLDAGVLD